MVAPSLVVNAAELAEKGTEATAVMGMADLMMAMEVAEAVGSARALFVEVTMDAARTVGATVAVSMAMEIVMAVVAVAV